MAQSGRHDALQVVGVIRDEQTDQELLERGVVLGVAEGGPCHVPERPGEVELLDLIPGRGRDVEVDVVAPLGVGVEEGADDVEELGLVGTDGDGDHLAVEVGGDVGGGDQRPELLEPLLAVEELAAVGQVAPEPLIQQAKLFEQDGGPVRPEAAAVEADVEQPVALVVGLLGRRVQQVLPGRVVTLQADLDAQGRLLVEPERGHAVEQQERQDVQELPLGVVPEDDPGILLVEDAIQGIVDLLRIHV